jgi:hypothetical protein
MGWPTPGLGKHALTLCRCAGGPRAAPVEDFSSAVSSTISTTCPVILGDETAQLVGPFMVARTWQAAARRAAIPERSRPDASLNFDECRNFLNLPKHRDEPFDSGRVDYFMHPGWQRVERGILVAANGIAGNRDDLTNAHALGPHRSPRGLKFYCHHGRGHSQPGRLSLTS